METMPCAEPRTLTNRYTLLRIAKSFSFTLGIVVLGKTLQRNLNHRYVLHAMRERVVFLTVCIQDTRAIVMSTNEL